MSDRNNVDTFISDEGIIESNKSKQTRRFVFLCNVLTFALAVLGIVAFIKGNF